MATAHLYRTQGTATDRKKFTVSMWVKLAKTGSDLTAFQFMDFYNSGSDRLSLYHDNSDKLNLYHQKAGGSASSVTFVSDMVLRDKTAWYHLVWRFDSTQATSTDRIKVYVNGEQITFGTYTFSEAQNYEFAQGTSSYTQYVGNYGGGSTNNFDGEMAHVHFCDGYSYAATEFGETDSTSGIWKPKTNPSVTYGTNGFFLKFANSASLGLDSSGNTNNLTVSGTGTQTQDTPSNNFAILNPLTSATHTGLTLANGNLTIDGNAGTAWRSLMATLGVSSGKWYYEVKVKNLNDNVRIGLIDVDQMLQGNGYFMIKSRGYSYNNDGQKSNNDSSASYGNSYTTNDIIGIAMDLDNGKLYFSKNGTYQNSGDPTSGSTGTGSAYDISSGYTYAPCIATYTATDKLECNFGNGRFGTTALASSNSDANGYGLFEYSVPSGYYALCTKNIKLYGG